METEKQKEINRLKERIDYFSEKQVKATVKLNRIKQVKEVDSEMLYFNLSDYISLLHRNNGHVEINLNQEYWLSRKQEELCVFIVKKIYNANIVYFSYE